MNTPDGRPRARRAPQLPEGSARLDHLSDTDFWMGRMPLDRPNHPGSPRSPRLTCDDTAHAVLDILAGTPLAEAAAGVRTEPAELAEAVEVYRQAGRHALEQQAACLGWWQLYIEFADWSTDEKTAVDHLAPLLLQAEQDGAITAWWFIRKAPCWRVRLRLRSQPQAADAKARVGAALDALLADGRVRRWWTGVYEPETTAFGGDLGVGLAHELFHADSHAILTALHHRENRLGRRELSVVLCGVLMRAAGAEWYEQGDIWHRVARDRPLPDDVAPDQSQALAADLKVLLLANTDADGPLFRPGGPAAFAGEWAAAFRRAGEALGAAAREGALERGLRHVIGYHVIFHWNRLGLSARTQSVLARTARSVILEM